MAIKTSPVARSSVGESVVLQDWNVSVRSVRETVTGGGTSSVAATSSGTILGPIQSLMTITTGTGTGVTVDAVVHAPTVATVTLTTVPIVHVPAATAAVVVAATTGAVAAAADQKAVVAAGVHPAVTSRPALLHAVTVPKAVAPPPAPLAVPLAALLALPLTVRVAHQVAVQAGALLAV